jgi:hypothetical protein
VPAKNESATIAETVQALLSISDVTQVLVIDDGSTDDTADRARAAGASVLRFPYNQGQAQAIMAGARTITDADIFLIVDGDIGASAVHTRDLLAPVLADEADMTIANIPASATGGFGTVKRTAQWGVRKATGVQLRAPISGQRAMRAGLLRSMQPSGHFGFSVSLSIDAARAGARVVEVDVPLTHRHTGKTLAGFVHRGKQGFFLLRALWPRLTSSRFRIGAAFTGFAVLAVVLVFSGAQHAKVHGIVQPEAKKVVIFGMPGLTWDELQDKAPNLERLSESGAVGALMVKTGSTQPSTHEAYAALGAGNPIRATLDAGLVLPADAPFEADTAANALARRTGHQPAGDIVNMGAAELKILNQSKHLSTDAGALGDDLAKAHLSTAVIGNADVAPFDDNSIQVVRRPAASAVMTSNGSVDTGEVGTGLLEQDADFAFGRRTDPAAFMQAFDRALGKADVIVADPGDLDRADESLGEFLHGPALVARDRALAATDALLGKVASRLDADTLLIVTGVRPPKGSWQLSPVVISGPGVPHGYVNSPGTHREGVATLFDLAPTILHALHVDYSDDFPGNPVKYQATTPDVGHLETLNRDASYRTDIFDPTTTAFIVVQLIAYLLIAVLLWFRMTTRWARQLRWIALAIHAFPAATFLYRAIPNVARLGTVGLLLLVVIDVLLVAIAQRIGGKRPLAAPAWLMGLTLLILVVDVATGNHLHLSSILGLSLSSAGRYYGFGNSSLALLAACSIMLGMIIIEECHSKREMAIIVSGFLAFIAFVDGAPMLGNDIGGIVTLVPVFTVVIARLLGWRLTWKTVLVGMAVGIGALGLAAGADLLRSHDSQTHFGKLLDSTGKDGWKPLTDTIQRKLGAVFRLAQNSIWTKLIPVGSAFLAFALGWRQRWKVVLAGLPALQLGIIASLAAGLLGSILNDSGPIVLAIVLSIVCPIVAIMVLQSEREDAPYLMEPTASPSPSAPTAEPAPVS